MRPVDTCMWAVSLALVLLQAAATTVVVSNSSSSNTTTFLAALEDQAVTRIVVASDYYSIGSSFDPYMPGGGRSPVSINRNVMVIASGGLESILDLNFAHSAAELCSSCTLTFANMTVANERRGPGGAVDFFLGQPGARVMFDSAVRFRPACTTAAESGAVADATKRSVYWPNPDGKQLWTIVNITFRGVAYPDQLHLIDHTVDDPRRVQEGRGPMGGVAVRTHNSTRICRATVDPACLKQRSSDTCVNMLVDEVLAQDAGAGLGGAAGCNMAGVAAGAAVAGAVLAAAILAGLLWMRRRRCRKQQLLPSGDFAKPFGPAASKSTRDMDGTFDIGTDKGPARKPDAPLGGSQDWELSWAQTTSLVPAGQRDAPVELGELLGAGSFGRVYKGTWGSGVVAVKVISHDSTSSDAVENEIELMLGFNHPNIVRAYHSLTYISSKEAKCSTTSNAMASAAPAASSATGDSFSMVRGSVSALGTPIKDIPQGFLPHATDTQPGSLPNATDTKPTWVPLPLCMSTTTGAAAQPLPGHPAAASTGQAALQGPASGSAAVTGAGEVLPGGRQQQAVASAAPSLSVPGLSATAHNSPSSVTAATAPTSSAEAEVAAGNPAAASAAGWVASAASASGGAWASSPSITCTTTSWGTAATPLARQPGKCAQRAETWIVQEYCDVGTLDSVVAGWDPAQEGDQRMLERLLLLKDVAQGLQALHSKHVVHGDLNARNVLVSSSASAPLGMVAKLADLGLSRVLQQHKTHRTTLTVGTMSHMPPELLRYGRMSVAADIYSFGISMWEMYTGTPAFKKLHYGQFFETVCLRNLRPLIPQGMPSDYRLLMENCWATEPVNRPSADRIIECLRYMIIERQKNLAAAAAGAAAAAAAAGGGAAAPEALAATADAAALSRVPSLLMMPLPERGSRTPAGAAAAPASFTGPSGSAAAKRRSSDVSDGASRRSASSLACYTPSWHSDSRLPTSLSSFGRARSPSLSLDIYGGGYNALSCPTSLIQGYGGAAGCAARYGAGERCRAEGDQGSESGHGEGEGLVLGGAGKGVELHGQPQPQGNVQEVQWFV